MNPHIDWRKYLLVFAITVALFVTAIYLSNYFGDRKISQLKMIQDQIALDILSSEAQFSLLSEMSCRNTNHSVLSGELDELGQKLEWGESNLGNTEEVAYIKKYYSLLQIKDYLLMKRITARCGVKSAFILYFYTTAENCSDCVRQGIVLTTLRNRYPELRVYSFDYGTDLSAVTAMLQIYKIKDTELPALVVDDEVLTGFQPIESLDQRITKTFKLQEAKSTTNGAKTE